MNRKFMSVMMVVAMLAAIVATNAAAEVKLEIGAKGGINLGDLTGDDADSLGTDLSMRKGFLGGAFLGAAFSESFGARLELLYAQRGVKSTFDGTDYTFKLDYVEIALYGVGTFPVNETVSVHAFAGPYVGFNAKAESPEYDETTMKIVEDYDISDEIKSMDFGLGVGAGVGFMASDALRIFIEGQYNLGFMSIDDTEDDWSLKNSGIGFTAGVAVPLSQ